MNTAPDLTADASAGTVAVVIPTRDRPERLRSCLDALERARRRSPFEVYVGDSSTTTDLRAEVAAVCAGYDFVHLRHHDGAGCGAARNFCTRIARAELLVNVDDDVYVFEDTIERLVTAYRKGSGWRAVAGTVSWGFYWSRPVVMRRIGYGRPARPNETPSFLIGALFIYPRALALACPWIETVPTYDDHVIGALWRAKGVQMLFAPDARALHDHKHNTYGVDESSDLIYANLFDALIANPSLLRAFEYELLCFLAGAKTYFRRPRSALRYLVAWFRGHKLLVRDWRMLTHAAHASLPPAPAS